MYHFLLSINKVRVWALGGSLNILWQYLMQTRCILKVTSILSVTQQMNSGICCYQNYIGYTLLKQTITDVLERRCLKTCVKHFDLEIAHFNLHRKVQLQSINKSINFQ